MLLVLAAVHNVAVNAYTDVCFQSKVPLVAFFDLMHLGVRLTAFRCVQGQVLHSYKNDSYLLLARHPKPKCSASFTRSLLVVTDLNGTARPRTYRLLSHIGQRF